MSEAGNRRTLNSLENEQLFNDIECALSMLHKNADMGDEMRLVRESYPSAVFFLETTSFLKEKLGFIQPDAFYYAMIPGIARYIVQEHFGERPRLNRLDRMSDYLKQLYRGLYKERFYGVLLDATGRKIETVLISNGTTSAALFDMKRLLSRVVQRHARAVVLCHNHPRGTPDPSLEDVQCTLKAMKALEAMGVALVDHIIIAYNRAISMRETGVIPAELWLLQSPAGKLTREWLKEGKETKQETGEDSFFTNL